MSVATDAPHVQIMNVVDAWDGANRRLDAIERHAAGNALKQNVQALANDADRRPQDHHANADGERGIDPALPGEDDRDAADNHGRGGESISDFVDDGAAHVNVA